MPLSKRQKERHEVRAFFKALAVSGLSQEDAGAWAAARYDTNYAVTGVRPLINKKNIESARVYRVLDANPAYAKNTAHELLSFANRAVKEVKIEKAVEIARLKSVEVDGVTRMPTLSDLVNEVTKAKQANK